VATREWVLGMDVPKVILDRSGTDSHREQPADDAALVILEVDVDDVIPVGHLINGQRRCEPALPRLGFPDPGVGLAWVEDALSIGAPADCRL